MYISGIFTDDDIMSEVKPKYDVEEDLKDNVEKKLEILEFLEKLEIYLPHQKMLLKLAANILILYIYRKCGPEISGFFIDC